MLARPIVLVMSFRRKLPFIQMVPSPSFSNRHRRESCCAKAAGVEHGSAEPNRVKVGKVTRSQLREIAETKLKDMNALNLEGAMRQLEGTARNMGITVVED